MDNDYITKKEFHETLAAIEERLTEKIRDAQTEILRAFYDWARPVNKRLGHVDELAQRLGWVEERVTKLEHDRLLGGQQ